MRQHRHDADGREWDAVVKDGLRSGELAEAAGVSIETLRYYERRGLLDKPRRTAGGHRIYSQHDLLTLRLIKFAQRLGFSLAEVAALLKASGGSPRPPAEALRAGIEDKLTDVDRRIAELLVLRDALRAALESACEDPATCLAGCCAAQPQPQLLRLENGPAREGAAADRATPTTVSRTINSNARGPVHRHDGSHRRRT